jgi:hypothetical protein
MSTAETEIEAPAPTVDPIKEAQKAAEVQAEQLRKLAVSMMPKDALAAAEQAKQAGTQPYTVQVGEDFYVYRTINRFEFRAFTMDQAKQITQLMESAEDPTQGQILAQIKREEALVMKCVVHPVLNEFSIKELPAGVIETIHNSIMATSGFGMEPIPVKL